MDQKKTGYFLKQLRNEKKLTQEQLAEKFQITSRTVSRWETGDKQRKALKTGTDHRNYRCDHNTDCNGHGRRWTGSVSVLGKCEAGSVCVDAWHAYCKHTVYNGMAQTDK